MLHRLRSGTQHCQHKRARQDMRGKRFSQRRLADMLRPPGMSENNDEVATIACVIVEVPVVLMVMLLARSEVRSLCWTCAQQCDLLCSKAFNVCGQQRAHFWAWLHTIH